MQANQEIIALITNTIKKDGWIDLPAQGISMFPFIREGNICRFISQKTSMVKKGDIVLFYSLTGQLIAHRLYKSFVYEGEQLFLFKGDSNLGFDDLVREKQIIGKLTHIQGRNVQSENFFANLYARLILVSPILSSLFRMYLEKLKTT